MRNGYFCVSFSLYSEIVFFSGWHCFWKAECSICSCCLRYSANKHVSFSPFLVFTLVTSLILTNFRILKSVAACISYFNVFPFESSFFMQLISLPLCNACKGGAMTLAVSKLQISHFWKLSFRYVLSAYWLQAIILNLETCRLTFI